MCVCVCCRICCVRATPTETSTTPRYYSAVPMATCAWRPCVTRATPWSPRCVSAYVCGVCIHPCVHTRLCVYTCASSCGTRITPWSPKCVYVCVRVHAFLALGVYIHLCGYTCVYSPYVRIPVCVCVCVFIHPSPHEMRVTPSSLMCVWGGVYIYIHRALGVYVYILTHIHPIVCTHYVIMCTFSHTLYCMNKLKYIGSRSGEKNLSISSQTRCR